MISPRILEATCLQKSDAELALVLPIPKDYWLRRLYNTSHEMRHGCNLSSPWSCVISSIWNLTSNQNAGRSDDSDLRVQWDEKTRRGQGYHIYEETRELRYKVQCTHALMHVDIARPSRLASSNIPDKISLSALWFDLCWNTITHLQYLASGTLLVITPLV
jgi:hypothetical protein